MLSCVGVSLMVLLVPLAFVASLAGSPPTREFEDLASGAATLASLVCALLVFGFVSRRFELQADAFAAQHLSGMSSANAGRGVVVTPEAAEAMAGALQSVAELNHIPVRRFTWRHGSIHARQRAVRSIVGAPADRIPIDRTVRRLKMVILIALLVTAAGVAADAWLASGAADSTRTTHPGAPAKE
jgi:Zn-dependent protease with chaperone function